MFAAEENRRESGVTTSSESKSRVQAYFKGAFTEARKRSDLLGEETDNENVSK